MEMLCTVYCEGIEHEGRLRNQLEPYKEPLNPLFNLYFYGQWKGQGQECSGGFRLEKMVAPFIKGKFRIERKDNKVIWAYVEAGAFVKLPGGGSVSRKQQMENQAWISGVRPRSYRGSG